MWADRDGPLGWGGGQVLGVRGGGAGVGEGNAGWEGVPELGETSLGVQGSKGAI